MSERFDHAFDPETAERLLDAAYAQTGGHGPLGDLLARAAAPGTPRELAGAPAAMAAFRAAQPAPLARGHTTLRRALALKAGALVAALAIGGVAFAAHSGVLPNPFPGRPSPGPADTSSAPATTPDGGDRSPSPAASATPAPSGSAAAASLTGLCRSFLATADKDKPKATESPRYAPLRAAAGGRDLTEYCTELLAAPGNRPTANPGNGASPKPSRAHPTPSHKNGAPRSVGVTPTR